MVAKADSYIIVTETHRIPVADRTQAAFLIAYVNEKGSTVTEDGVGIYDGEIDTTVEASFG